MHLIIRHQRENLKKCSLTPLHNRKDLTFISYPFNEPPSLEGYTILTGGAPVLESAEALCLIDATWVLAEKIDNSLDPSIRRRSLPPGFVTAYPRKQTGCFDPLAGLASVEALFVAYHVLGLDTTGLLDNYYWKQPFLEANSQLLFNK